MYGVAASGSSGFPQLRRNDPFVILQRGPPSDAIPFPFQEAREHGRVRVLDLAAGAGPLVYWGLAFVTLGLGGAVALACALALRRPR